MPWRAKILDAREKISNASTEAAPQTEKYTSEPALNSLHCATCVLYASYACSTCMCLIHTNNASHTRLQKKKIKWPSERSSKIGLRTWKHRTHVHTHTQTDRQTRTYYMHDCIQNMAACISVLASTKVLGFHLTCQIWQQFRAGTLVPQGQGNSGELLYGVQSQLRSREGKRDWTMNTYNHLTRLYLDTTTGFLALTV